MDFINDTYDVDDNLNFENELDNSDKKSESGEEVKRSMQLIELEATKLSSFLFDPESSEDEDKEGDVVSTPNIPYGQDYEPITSVSLKVIANKLGLIRLCWPPKSLIEIKNLQNYPHSYRINNSKEKMLLLYAENFRRQYQMSFPKKKPLLLAAYNECDTQKMVCTTICPTKLRYPEFYTWQGCGKFISEHIIYKPLEKPTSLPSKLISGEMVLLGQFGHCFEMSTVLVSYLLAAGYDAYVVSGYATREYCNNDQSYTEYPEFASEKQKNNIEEETYVTETKKVSKYTIKEPFDFRSKFLLMMEKRESDKREMEIQDQLKLEQLRIEELERPPFDTLYGWRIHSWVLIIPGKRNVEEIIFLEPSTGIGSSPTNPQYLGIESIWNNTNYWINLQNCTNGCKDLSFDIQNVSCWKHLLPGEPWYWREIKTGSYVEPKDVILQEKHLDMPFSWVNPLLIPHEKYENRYPTGQKIIKYKKVQVELFAPYLLKDGLVSRITVYEDYEYQNPLVVYENFNNRQDNLEKLTKYVVKNQRTEEYKPGREDALKKHSTIVNNGKKSMEFYHTIRYDGLSKVIMDNASMSEKFKEREDRLYLREVIFEGTQPLPEYRLSYSSLDHRPVKMQTVI
uniref:Dynein regulatory complex subunit 7 n=1 Tax=Clastoptera arizonana TaxID=38151 RepID=A0A1B6DIF5_9HEMI